MTYSISIIINAYNESNNIVECINSLKKQSLSPLEIIVVDNGSTDRTAELAENLGVNVFKIKPVTRGKARDFGWRKAKGDIVAYLDADMVVNNDWIKEIVNQFEEGANAVIDRIAIYSPDNAFTKSLDAFYKFRYDNNYKPFIAWMFKKSLLEKLNGFKDLWIEDAELGKRILDNGYKIHVAKKAIRYHKGPPRSFGDMIKRNYFFGKNESLDFYKANPELFPWVKVTLYLLFMFTQLFSLTMSFTNHLFILWIPFSLIILYVFLLLKLLFINGTIGKISIENSLLITFASWIRALIWPLGLIKGRFLK